VQQAKSLFALGREDEALELVAAFPAGPLANEISLLRELIVQLGACAIRADRDESSAASDREARISQCMQLAAASLGRMKERGFVSWDMVWALPEMEPFQDRAEIPAECLPDPDSAQ
jgi:hypothetical protein